MAKPLLDDALWSKIEPLLPPHPPRLKGGRPRLPDRAALTGILFVLRTGIPWEYLPKEMGCGSGMTCWRRLRDWQAAGVWQQLHQVMLVHLQSYAQIDWTRVSVDGASIPAPPGGAETGPNPTDRGKLGCKHHLAVDSRGLPLAVILSGANRHDSKCFIPVLEAIPPIRGLPGHPRRRPEKVHADKGYDFPYLRQYLQRRGIRPRIARRGIESRERLGRYRWVVERTFSWLHRMRRLRIRYERRADIHQAFLQLGCALIAWNFIQRFC
ncbi:IS5 family transposase [Thermithiobacillus plumbiphilus]|uniref:IS5 family transposase n=1 Tax=Thermithiobacillus plumbiphilus TaxID=1729899 RepID=A0ABU9D6D1_9PROT